MKRKLMLCAVVAGGLVLGLLAGSRLAGGMVRTDFSRDETTTAKRQERQRPVGGAAREDRRDYKSLLKACEKRMQAGSALNAEMARLGVGELKSLLEESAAKLAASGNDPELEKIIAAVGAELFNREGEAAIGWAAGRPLSGERKTIVSAVMDAAATKNPVATKPWIDSLRMDYGSMWAQNLVQRSVKGAASRSADELIEVLKLHEGESSWVFHNFGPFADDFDFHRLVTEMPGLEGSENAFKVWSAKDRDAAWTGLMGLVDGAEPRNKYYVGMLLEGISEMEGMEKAGAWISGKLEGLTEAQRSNVVDRLYFSGMTLPQTLSLMNALPTDTDRMKYASSHAGPYWKSVDEVLDALPQELRSESIIRSAELYPGLPKDSPTEGDVLKSVTHYDRLMEKYGVREAVRERVRKGLRDRLR